MKTEHKRKKRKWVQTVITDSTHPPKGIFTKDAETIARVMSSKKVSPLGRGSAIKMIQYFINRGGKGLSSKRRAELEKAKNIIKKKYKSEKN